MKTDIAQIKPGTVACTLLLIEATRMKTKTQKDYINMSMSDGRNTINAKIWNCGEIPEIGKVYDFEANAAEYAGSMQLTISSVLDMRISNTAIGDFAPTRGYNVAEATQVILTAIDSMHNPTVKAFCTELFVDELEEWKQATGAKAMHHVQAGGLIQHTAEVVYIASQLGETLEDKLIDRDLLVAGAILHDIGKLDTYALNIHNGISFDMTTCGRLSEHIVTGVKMLSNSVAACAHPNIALLLEHIIVSHHGKLEFGSPVAPCMIEALLVHTADELSAKLDMLDKAIEESNSDDCFSKAIYGLSPGFSYGFMLPAYVTRLMQEDFKNYLDEKNVSEQEDA